MLQTYNAQASNAHPYYEALRNVICASRPLAGRVLSTPCAGRIEHRVAARGNAAAGAGWR